MPEREMIGDYKGEVKNKVVTALFQAYLDVLDYDGLKSILKEAELLDLKNYKEADPDESLDFFSFKKIITAQNCLLYNCNDLLFEIGKKFSFYLFPFGKKFEEVVEEINKLIKTDWNIQIIEKTKKAITVRVEKCFFCSEIGISCDLIMGFLLHSIEKTLPPDKRVDYDRNKEDIKDPNHNTFVVKFKSKKK
jgi:predicted hydrocarbon binding protein